MINEIGKINAQRRKGNWTIVETWFEEGVDGEKLYRNVQLISAHPDEAEAQKVFTLYSKCISEGEGVSLHLLDPMRYKEATDLPGLFFDDELLGEELDELLGESANKELYEMELEKLFGRQAIA